MKKTDGSAQCLETRERWGKIGPCPSQLPFAINNPSGSLHAFLSFFFLFQRKNKLHHSTMSSHVFFPFETSHHEQHFINNCYNIPAASLNLVKITVTRLTLSLNYLLISMTLFNVEVRHNYTSLKIIFNSSLQNSKKDFQLSGKYTF